METMVWETAEEMNRKLAQRMKTIRNRREISLESLSEGSGVNETVVRNFENTGEISLLDLTKIAMALGVSNEIQSLFTEVPYRSIEEVIHEAE